MNCPLCGVECDEPKLGYYYCPVHKKFFAVNWVA